MEPAGEPSWCNVDRPVQMSCAFSASCPHLLIPPLYLSVHGVLAPPVEGLCALLPLAHRAGGYKYPSLPSVRVRLLTLQECLVQQHLSDQQRLIEVPCPSGAFFGSLALNTFVAHVGGIYSHKIHLQKEVFEQQNPKFTWQTSE